MFPGMEDLMRQAQQMGQRMNELKAELARRTVTGTAGGGMVTATANGAMQILSIEIEPEVIDPAEADMLKDLVVAAVNQALSAAREMAAEETRKVTGGMPMPPGLENLFGGKTDGAPCTDAVNKNFYKKELAGAILCFPTTVGSTMGGVTLMGVGSLGQGPKAMLYAEHADSVSLAGLLIDDIWNDRRVITIDLLGDEFIEAVKTGDPIAIHEDGTVEIG